MKNILKIFFVPAIMLFAAWPVVGSVAAAGDPTARPPRVRIGQLVQGRAGGRRLAHVLPSLLSAVASRTTLPVEPEPVIIESFEDPLLFRLPFIYVNFADRADWNLTEVEKQRLREYLERGGFVFIDAGITSEFLRGNTMFGQTHSFPDWEPSPEIRDAFKTVFPELEFQTLPRSHRLFRSFYRGLPDPASLPDSVRDYVIHEKWPDGSYSAVGIKVDGRLAVLATPIISIGWGRDSMGQWTGNISFRIREGAEGLDQRLQTASYGGLRY